MTQENQQTPSLGFDLVVKFCHPYAGVAVEAGEDGALTFRIPFASRESAAKARDEISFAIMPRHGNHPVVAGEVLGYVPEPE